MRYSSIDIGTNSVILLILDLDKKEEIIIDRPVITRLGEALTQTGFLSDTAMERTIRVLKEFKEILEEKKALKTFPFGTWALREAKNAEEFIERVERETGFVVKVLSEKEEAFFNYLSIVEDQNFEYSGEVIVDVGGGSSEVITTFGGEVTSLHSIPIGAVKLKEEVLRKMPAGEKELTFAMEICDRVLQECLEKKRGELIGIGGSVTTLCAMTLGKGIFEQEAIHGRKIFRERLKRIIDEVKGLSPNQILHRFPFIGKGRADIILPGAIILFRLMTFFDSSYVKVSAKGVRYGVIYWMAKDSQRDGVDPRCCKIR